jgi:hypothetical protein
MPIVQPNNDGTDLFRIVLPDSATAEQKALKTKIDALLEILKQKQGDPNYSTWIKDLRAIAVEGFDTSQDIPAATAKVDALEKALVRPKPKDGPPSQHVGAFEVWLPDPNKPSDKGISWREIIFDVTGDLVPVPPEQLRLQADVDTTLTTLRTIFPDAETDEKPKHPTINQRRFESYQTKLLGIARTGLQTPADPESARQWLEALQAEILAREGPRVKNGYMKTLGLAAAIFAVIAAGLYLVLRNNPQLSHLLYIYRNLFILWAGTMIGTWLSFGLRRPKIMFKDLGILEEDMVEPAIRLIFTGLIAITIAFIFICGMVSINVGDLKSADLFGHGSTALLIGILLGVSEQALPGVLTRRASQFVSEIGGKT